MKVHELIATLQDYDADLDIRVATTGTSWYYNEEIGQSEEIDIVEISGDFRVEREDDYLVLR